MSYDNVSKSPEGVQAALPKVTRADVLSYYATAPQTVNLQVDQARETELQIEQINKIINAELDANPHPQANLYFHGTIDTAWDQIQNSGTFKVPAGRACITRTPSYSTQRYALMGSETNMVTVIQEKIPQFQAEGLLPSTGSIYENIADINDLLVQPKFQEQYGRLLVFNPDAVAQSGFSISNQNKSGADNTIGAESFSFYPTGAAATETQLQINIEAISAAIIPTEIVTRMLADIRTKLISNQQFNVTELQKTAMLYFGLATQRQLELTHPNANADEQLRQQVRLGRELVLAEVQGYFEERMQFINRLLTNDERNLAQGVPQKNLPQFVEQQVQQLNDLQEYAQQLYNPTIITFVKTQVTALGERYKRLLEQYDQFVTSTQQSQESITEAEKATATENPSPDKIKWQTFPPQLTSILRRVFKL